MAVGFELRILTDLSGMPERVETNIDDVQPIIDAAIERTKGLEVTDNKDEILAADADAAKLRKMSDAIKRFRIDHINAWTEPMSVFEEKCKKAEKALTNAAADITTKTGEVKELWRTRKREKYAKVWSDKLAEAFGDDRQLIDSEHAKAFLIHWTDAKTKGTWVNSSVSETAVTTAMDTEIQRMKDTLDAMGANYAGEAEEVKAKARIALCQRFDMNDVIQAVNAWKAEQKAIAERAEAERQRKASQDAAMEAQKRALAEKRAAGATGIGAGAPAPAPKPAPAPATAPTSEAQDDGNLVETYRLEVKGTRDALKKLKAYGVSIGIDFKNIDSEEEK